MQLTKHAWFLLLYAVSIGATATEEPVGVSAMKAEAERFRDEAGFDAIGQLHKQMDDDHSGSVDVDESQGFVREELHIQEKDRLNRRQQTFHVNNDNFITVEDMWTRWLQSSERNWTVDDTLQWLRESVELPQYETVFQRNAVDGLTLPRMATQNNSFLVNVLKVTNPVHRQKLQLKAMDVVLFGYRLRETNYWKDAMLIGCLTVAVFLFVVNRFQKTKAQNELNKLHEHKSKLMEVQDHFQNMQEKLEEEMQKHEKFQQNAKEDESKKSQEVQILKQQLQNAERRIEQGVMVSGFAPLALQPLLRKTCEHEVARINRDKLESLAQMREAIETVEKLKKKQASVMYSMKLAVSSGSVMETLDQKISQIKQKMEATGKSMEECQHRWTQIESLCGYPILDTSLGVGSGGLPRPASLNGIAELTRLPLALTSALAAVPNAFNTARSGGFMRPQLVTTPLEEIDENAAISPSQSSNSTSIIQPKVSAQFYSSRPMPRSMINFGTMQPVVTAPSSNLMSAADLFVQTKPRFTLGASARTMNRSESAENVQRSNDESSSSAATGPSSTSARTNTNVASGSKENNNNSESPKRRKPAPPLEIVGRTDSHDSAMTVLSAGGAGNEEQRAKKRAKLIQFLSGKKEKGL